MKKLLFASLLAAIALLLTASAQNPTPDLYRFAVLRVAKGTIIETLDGKYIALGDERWFNEAQCLALQRENVFLQEALARTQRLRQADASH